MIFHMKLNVMTNSFKTWCYMFFLACSHHSMSLKHITKIILEQILKMIHSERMCIKHIVWLFSNNHFCFIHLINIIMNSSQHELIFIACKLNFLQIKTLNIIFASQ